MLTFVTTAASTIVPYLDGVSPFAQETSSVEFDIGAFRIAEYVLFDDAESSASVRHGSSAGVPSTGTALVSGCGVF